MQDQMSNRNRQNVFDVHEVGGVDGLPVDDGDDAGADDLQAAARTDDNTGVFGDADAQDARLDGDGLGQAVEPAPFFEMGIDNKIRYKAEPGGEFYLSFQMGTDCAAVIDHRAGHGHGAGAGAGNDEGLIEEPGFYTGHQAGAPQDGRKAELIPAGEQDAIAFLDAIKVFGQVRLFSFSNKEMADVLTAQGGKRFKIDPFDHVGYGGSGGDQFNFGRAIPLDQVQHLS